MTLQSMTGFARDEGHLGDDHWVWEIRSVNGKSLDLRFRLPSGLENLEPKFRDVASEKLKRGNLQISLQLDTGKLSTVAVLNEKAFQAALEIARNAAEISNLPMPSLDSLLAIKGVVEQVNTEEDEAVVDARNEAILRSFSSAIDSIFNARASEGAAIAAVLLEQVNKIETLTKVIKLDRSRSVEVIAAKLTDQLSKLLGQTDGLDAQRLHQEAAILATKSDLQEELDRLDAHIASARELLSGTLAVGRKLDFLSQEFNRECNTICSKSNAASVTHAGLEMKVVIDQFREQVQNIQ
jgi:uncharacterized protein (TIGR00255 family)